MKKYIEPKIKVSMFSVETITTTQDPVVAQSFAYGTGVNTFLTQQSATAQKIKKQYNFDEAIKFN